MMSGDAGSSNYAATAWLQHGSIPTTATTAEAEQLLTQVNWQQQMSQAYIENILAQNEISRYIYNSVIAMQVPQQGAFASSPPPYFPDPPGVFFQDQSYQDARIGLKSSRSARSRHERR